MFAASAFIALVLGSCTSSSTGLLEVAARDFDSFSHGIRSPEPDAALLVIFLVSALASCLLGDGLLPLLGLRGSRTTRLLRDFSLVTVLGVRADRDLDLVVLFLGLLVLESDLVLLGA